MRTRLLSLVLSASLAHADDPGRDIRYVAPTGFSGHHWGDLRSAFDRLPRKPTSVGAAWMRVRERHAGFSCQLETWIPKYQTAWVEQCKHQATLNNPNAAFKGGGMYVVSEYNIDAQGFRFGDEQTGVVLHPITYQFCANWPGKRKAGVPPNFAQLDKFCGMRLSFESETYDDLRNLPSDHVTDYDRVLETLIDLYGYPNGFKRRGKVYVSSADDEPIITFIRGFRSWHWCPAGGDGFRTFCKASVTLTFNPASGTGSIQYATPVLWEFAFARENFGFQGDPLFALLHARN
jgi:hypothetical protein